VAEKDDHFSSLYRLILTVADDQLRVPLEDGTRKHIRDLAHGDVVPVVREDGLYLLQFCEDDGALFVIDFKPDYGKNAGDGIDSAS
jgi:hypothetical protein